MAVGPDGVRQIYPTKPGGEEWYLGPFPASDPRFRPQNPISLNGDGSWKMRSSKVRMEVLTSTGYEVPTVTDRKILADRGWMLAPNDWRNVEITGYVRLNRASDPRDAFTWYARGGRHTDSAPCEGSSMKGNLGFDGRVRVEKESWHVSYAQGPWRPGVRPLVGRWVGLKVAIFNMTNFVRCELWVDEGDSMWKWIYRLDDGGDWDGDAIKCGAANPKMPITWGGPVACFRWDHAEDVDFRRLSVREIADMQSVTVPVATGGNVTVPKIDHFEQVAPDRILRTVVDGRDVFVFTVKPGDVQDWDRGNVGPGGKPNSRAEISYAAEASADKGKSPYSVTDKTGPRTYEISMKFAEGWPTDQRWATLLQFHARDDASGVGFGGISVHGGSIDFMDPADPNRDKYVARIPLTVGRWYDFKLEINWSSGQDGYLKVFNGGQPFGEYHGPTIPAGEYKYLKQGYYRDGAIDRPGTVYQTPLQITEGAAAQPAPPVSPPPAPPEAPPAQLPIIALPAKAEAGRQLLVALRPRIEFQMALVMQLKADFNSQCDMILTDLEKARNEVATLLDKGPWA